MMEPLCAVPLIGAAAYASQKLGELCTAANPLDRFLNENTGSTGPKPLLGNNPRPGKNRTNTDLPDGREAAEKLFEKETRGQKTNTEKMKDGGTREYTEDGTAIRRHGDDSLQLGSTPMPQDKNLPSVHCHMSMAARCVLDRANNRVCSAIVTSDRRSTSLKDVWSISRIAFATEDDVVILCAESVDVGRNFELFRLSAIAEKMSNLEKLLFTPGLANTSDHEFREIIGRQLEFCLLSEPRWETQVELIQGSPTNVAIFEDSALLVYALATPRILVWHNDDRPLELNFTTSHDLIANKIHEARDWNFI